MLTPFPMSFGLILIIINSVGLEVLCKAETSIGTLISSYPKYLLQYEVKRASTVECIVYQNYTRVWLALVLRN